MSGKRPTVGSIAVHNGLVTQDQVDECLAIQRVMAKKGFDMPLGQIMVEKYYLEEKALRAILKAQESAGDERDRTRRWVSSRIRTLTAEENQLLIEHVSQLRIVDLEELDHCIEIQQALAELGITKRLGEIIIERGWIDRNAVRDILVARRGNLGAEPRGLSMAEEAAERIEPARGSTRIVERERFLFGQIAIERKLVDLAQVEEMLACQRRFKELGVIKRLGELLVERGWLSLPDVRRVLDLQRMRFGRINWLDLSGETFEPSEHDRWFRDWLLRSGLVEPEQVQECLYILEVFHEMGFATKTLANVVVDRGYLEAKTVRDALFER